MKQPDLDSMTIEQLLNEAARIAKITDDKLAFVMTQMRIPVEAIQALQVQVILDWFMPEFTDGVRNPERLKFDIFSNKRLIAMLDAIMRGQSPGLHVVGNGEGGDGSSQPE